MASPAAMAPPRIRNGQIRVEIVASLGSFSSFSAMISSSMWVRSARRRVSGLSSAGAAAAAASASVASGSTWDLGRWRRGDPRLPFRQDGRRLVGGGDGHPAEPLEQDLGGLLVDVQVLDRRRPVGLGPPPPLDPLVAGPLEERQRLPAGLVLDLLAPALLLLELLVGLLLGPGVLVLLRLGIALEDGLDLLALPLVLGPERFVVDLVRLVELLRRRLVFLLLAVLAAAEPQLDLGFALGPVGDQGFQVGKRVGLDLDQWRLGHDAGILVASGFVGWVQPTECRA